MVLAPVKCPFCGKTDVRKSGKSGSGKQRYLCDNTDCPHKTFSESYTYNAYNPEIRDQIFFEAVNGNGIRATARILGISNNTVIETLRSVESNVWHVNHNYIKKHKDEGITVEIIPVDEVEMDEMWSFVSDKSQQYWLWWAIDHKTGEPLAFHFGTRKHENLDELLKLLSPFDIEFVYADNNFAYENHITGSLVVSGKRNTQKIERKHLSLRTWCSRLVRKGIRFSKRHDMHSIVIGLVINFWFFGHLAWQ